MLAFIRVVLAVAGVGGIIAAVVSLVLPGPGGAYWGLLIATLGFGLLGVLLKLDSVESTQANMMAAAVQDLTSRLGPPRA